MFCTTKRKRILLGILTALLLAFIWGNSCMTAEASGELSDGIGAWLAGILGEVSITVIRKFAHFSEFAALGFLLQWQRLLWNRESPSGAILLGLLAAMTDETIQLFSPGRASQIQDVWIDFGGVLAGTLLLGLLWILLRRRKH